MIAVVDIGNSRTKLGLFDFSGGLVEEKAVAAEAIAPESAAFFSAKVSLAVIGSVVPNLTPIWKSFFENRGERVHIANAASPWGFAIEVENPDSIGVDRLANMEAALSSTGATLVVDAGTATKFDLLEGVDGQKRKFVGGAIAPGMKLSYEALIAQAAQLTAIELNKFSPVVGYNTETAIRSGVVHGFASQVDGMILRIFEERKLPQPVAVVATGGDSRFLKSRARLITNYRPHLTLEGLYAIARKI